MESIFKPFSSNLFKFQVAKNLEPEQAKRIFDACDAVSCFENIWIVQKYFKIINSIFQSGDKQISLDEFRTMANMKTEWNLSILSNLLMDIFNSFIAQCCKQIYSYTHI